MTLLLTPLTQRRKLRHHLALGFEESSSWPMSFSLYGVIFFLRPTVACQKTGLQAQSLFVCSCIRLFRLTHKAIDFLTGGGYINCGLSVGLTIEIAISVFILGFRKAQRELLPRVPFLRLSLSQHFRTHNTVF